MGGGFRVRTHGIIEVHINQPGHAVMIFVTDRRGEISSLCRVEKEVLALVLNSYCRGANKIGILEAIPIRHGNKNTENLLFSSFRFLQYGTKNKLCLKL